jgi:cysteine-rich repeat protein
VAFVTSWLSSCGPSSLDNAPSDGSSSSAETDDRGTSSTESTAAVDAGSSGGLEPGCGNGRLDPGEECDDDNTEDGDTCSATCAIPSEVIWTVTHGDPDPSNDQAVDVVIGPDDAIYVVGSIARVGSNEKIWLQQIFPDGTLGWSLEWDGPDQLGDAPREIAWMHNGDLAIVGSTSLGGTSGVLLLVVDITTHAELWHRRFDDPDLELNDLGEALAVSPDGDVVVGGQVRGDRWLGRYSAAGELRWSQTYAEGGGTKALMIDDEGRIRALGYAFVRSGGIEHSIAAFDSDGTPLEDETVAIDEHVNDIVAVPGGYVLTGVQRSETTGPDVRTWSVDTGWDERWVMLHDGPAHESDSGYAVAVGFDGTVAAAGRQQSDNGFDGWLGVYRADGTRWWSAVSSGHPAETGCSYDAVAIDSVGDVIAVGSEPSDGSTVGVIRKYRALW